MKASDRGLGQQPEWIKSSLSFANGNCVEVAWVKSSACDGGACLEVTGLETEEIKVRNSRFPDGPVLTFTPAEWDAFVGGVMLGEFDRFGGDAAAVNG